MKDPRTELAALSVALRERLERARDQGRTSILVREGSVSTPIPAAAPTPASRGKKLPLVPIEPELPDRAQRMAKLAEIAKEVSGCRQCTLCETRTQTVFARGSGRTRVM